MIERRRGLHRALVSVALVLTSSLARAQLHASWVPTWTTSVYRLESDALLSQDQFTDATLRQAVRISLGGERIRIVVSNAAGHQPLAISGVHVALSGPSGTASIEPQSDQEVRFDGRAGVVVASGGTAISDAVSFAVQPLARVSISMHFFNLPEPQTGHRRSLSSSWIAHGEQLDAHTLASAVSLDHWYNLAALQVEAPYARVIVAFGDSLTDGSRSTVNGNDRWPDLLAERLQASAETRLWAVANQGLAGNQLLADDHGRSAIARFDRDVLAQPHARTVILLAGINDLGQSCMTTPSDAARRKLVRQIESAYRLLATRARAHGLRILGATLPPYTGSDYHPTPMDERERLAINAWIRAAGHFDAVIDWDTVLRDPDDPSRLTPEFDSGDHIHPSQAGYRAMADAIPLGELVK